MTSASCKSLTNSPFLTARETDAFVGLAPDDYFRCQFRWWLETPKFHEFFCSHHRQIAKFIREASSPLDGFSELQVAHALATIGVDIVAYHGKKRPDLECAAKALRFLVEVKHLHATEAQNDVRDFIGRLEKAVQDTGKPYSVEGEFFCGDQNELLPHEKEIKHFIVAEIEKAAAQNLDEVTAQHGERKHRRPLVRIQISRRKDTADAGPRFICLAHPVGSMHGPHEDDKVIQHVGKILAQTVPDECNIGTIVADSSAYSHRLFEIALATIFDHVRRRDDGYFAGITFRNKFRDTAHFESLLGDLAGFICSDGNTWQLHPNPRCRWKPLDKQIWAALAPLDGQHV